MLPEDGFCLVCCVGAWPAVMMGLELQYQLSTGSYHAHVLFIKWDLIFTVFLFSSYKPMGVAVNVFIKIKHLFIKMFEDSKLPEKRSKWSEDPAHRAAGIGSKGDIRGFHIY